MAAAAPARMIALTCALERDLYADLPLSGGGGSDQGLR